MVKINCLVLVKIMFTSLLDDNTYIELNRLLILIFMGMGELANNTYFVLNQYLYNIFSTWGILNSLYILPTSINRQKTLLPNGKLKCPPTAFVQPTGYICFSLEEPKQKRPIWSRDLVPPGTAPGHLQKLKQILRSFKKY